MTVEQEVHGADEVHIRTGWVALKKKSDNEYYWFVYGAIWLNEDRIWTGNTAHGYDTVLNIPAEVKQKCTQHANEALRLGLAGIH